MAVCESSAASAKVTFASTPPARMRPVRTAGRSNVEVIADAYDPHCRVRPQRSVAAPRCEPQLGGAADAAELVVGPCAHNEPTLMSDLMARRSSIAAYASGVASRSVS